MNTYDGWQLLETISEGGHEVVYHDGQNRKSYEAGKTFNDELETVR